LKKMVFESAFRRFVDTELTFLQFNIGDVLDNFLKQGRIEKAEVDEDAVLILVNGRLVVEEESGNFQMVAARQGLNFIFDGDDIH